MDETTNSWTTLALLLRPQGRKGELLAELFTDFPESFTERRQVWLARPRFAGTAGQARGIVVSNHWLPVGKNSGRIVLHFEGIDSINDAELLNGLEVIVPDEARVELEEDEEYIDDLLGCTVYDDGQAIGQVTGVDFPTTPDGGRRLPDAAPLLTVETASGDEVLIPYVNDFLERLSVEEKRIDMKLPPGLVGLNAAGAEEGGAEEKRAEERPQEEDAE